MFSRSLLQLSIFNNFAISSVICGRHHGSKSLGSFEKLMLICGAPQWDAEHYKATRRIVGETCYSREMSIVTDTGKKLYTDAQKTAQTIFISHGDETQVVIAVWSYLWHHRNTLFEKLDMMSSKEIDKQTLQGDVLAVCKKLVNGVLIGSECIDLVKLIYVFFVRQIITTCPVLSKSQREVLHDELYNRHSMILPKHLSNTFKIDTINFYSIFTGLIVDLCLVVYDYIEDSEFAHFIDEYICSKHIM